MPQIVQVIVLLSIIFVCKSTPTVTIPTSFGSIVGLERGETVEFLGIPFAEPPLDDLRFAPPKAWEAPSYPYVLNATKFGSACMQSKSLVYDFPGDPDEDCLYLNVYTPKSNNISSMNLPVMLWIHGGGFTKGSASELNYNGTILSASHNVIIVTTNYRLGAFGFLAETAFCNEDQNCGMYGILDQQMALLWIQGNIKYFGGNPNNVTIFGESAGAMSVGIHLVLSSSNGLFHKAIMESGMAEGYPLLENALIVGNNLTNELGCISSSFDKVTRCMRRQRSHKILKTQRGSNWWPVINNYNLHQQPMEYLQSGNYNQVPLLIGCNGNEGSLFALLLYPPPVSKEEYEEIIQENFGNFAPEILEAYPLSDYGYSGFRAIEAITGDYLFVCPAQYIVEATMTENYTYMYLFNHTPSWSLEFIGPYHGSEINFVFGFRPEKDFVQFTGEERLLSDNMTTWWTNFAKYASPDYNSINNWPPYTQTSTDRIVITTGPPQYISSYRASQCDLWRTYYQLYYPTQYFTENIVMDFWTSTSTLLN